MTAPTNHSTVPRVGKWHSTPTQSTKDNLPLRILVVHVACALGIMLLVFGFGHAGNRDDDANQIAVSSLLGP